MSDTYIYLSNIPETCSWLNLHTTFGEFGKISKIYMHPKREFAKVFYESVESGEKACEFVNENRPMGMSGSLFSPPPKTRGYAVNSESSYEFNPPHRNTNYKKRYTTDNVDTSVNRNYTDVFGRIVTTLRDDNGELYISLEELKKSGFELFQVGSLPVRNGSRIYDSQKMTQFESFMKAKAAEFMTKFDFKVTDENVNKIIKDEEQDYFSVKREVTIGSGGNATSPPLLYIKTNNPNSSPKRETDPSVKTDNVPKSYSNGPAFERNKIKRESVDTPIQTNSQKNNDELDSLVDNNLRRPTTIEEKPVVAKPLSRVSPILNKDQEVEIAHVDNDKKIWVQLVSSMDVIESILLKLMTEAEIPSTVKPSLNMICAAMYQNIWFRATILNTSPLKVQYIDYGNENTEPLKEVVKLSDNLSSIPAQAFPIKFESHVDVEQGSRMTIHPIKQEDDGTYSVRAVKPKPVQSTAISSPPKPSRKLSIDTVEKNAIFEFAMRTGENTFTAFGLPDTLSNDLSMLEEIGKDCKPDTNFIPYVGDLVAAQTSQGFVRVVVISQLNENYKCGLIDFGTIETSKEICLLPDKYVSIPAFSFECKLDAHKIDEIENCKSGTLEINSPGSVTFKLDSGKQYGASGYCWNPFATTSSSNEDRKPAVVKPNENKPIVTVTSSPNADKKPAVVKPNENKPIVTSLSNAVENPAAVKSTENKPIVKPERKTVVEKVSDSVLFYFVDETGDNTFVAFVCPESYTQSASFLEELNDDVSFDKTFAPNTGDLVVANSPEGCVRALVLDVIADKYKCALIDYGTVILVQQVCSLPNKYLDVPQFAVECKVAPNGIQDLKNYKCASCTISSPNVLTLTLENKKEYTVKARCWNPLQNTKKSTEKLQEPVNKIEKELPLRTPSPSVKKSTDNVQVPITKVEKEVVKRKLVIEEICESGIFECVKALDENRFIAFAVPDSYTDKLVELDKLSVDCKFDPNFKPNLNDLVALKTPEGVVRGVILSVNNSEYSCALIDYGTIATAKKVCKVPQKYVEIPDFAFVCKIDNGSVDDFKNSECTSLQIKTPKVLKVTLASGKHFVLHGSHWDPSSATGAKEAPVVSRRKLVIDNVCETGVFEFVQRTSDSTFIAFAFPCTFVAEVDKLNKLSDYCTPDPLFSPKPGDLVAVPDPNGLVRATILGESKGRYKCALIDYGLITIVNAVYPLPDHYKSIPEFAFEGTTDSATLEILENISCKFMIIKSPNALTLILENGKVINIKGHRWDPSKTNPLTRKQTVTKLKLKQATFKGEPSGKILKDKEQVIVLGVLKNVVLVRTKETNSVFKLINQEFLNFKGDLLEETPQVDDLVVCNFSDNNLYRVVVRSVDGDTASIEYVDTGNCAQVSVKYLKTISNKLASVENTLFKIRLKGFENIGFNENMLKVLKECAETKEKFIAVKVDTETNVMDLIGGNSIPLSSRLLELVKPPRTSTPGSTKRDRIMQAISLRKRNICKLNDITEHNIKTGPNEFLCLFTSFLHEGTVSFCKADEETTQLLNDITLAIPDYVENDNVAYEPELYEVCLVKFEDEWHRAAVIKVNEDNTFGVFFVDYGNSHVVSKNDIRKLPEKLGKIRGLAILCTLEGVIKDNEETVNEPLLSRLKNDIFESNIYNVDVISFRNNEYRITIPCLLEKWKKDGLL